MNEGSEAKEPTVLAYSNRDLNHRNLESGGASRVLWSNVSFWAHVSSSAALPGVSSASTHTCLQRREAAFLPRWLIPSKDSWNCQAYGKFFLILRWNLPPPRFPPTCPHSAHGGNAEHTDSFCMAAPLIRTQGSRCPLESCFSKLATALVGRWGSWLLSNWVATLKFSLLHKS